MYSNAKHDHHNCQDSQRDLTINNAVWQRILSQLKHSKNQLKIISQNLRK